MGAKKLRTHPRQLSLLDLPDLSVDAKISESMARIVKASNLSREQALDLLNGASVRWRVNLSGGSGKLSLALFEKWLNPNEPQYRPPFPALNLFCFIFKNIEPFQISMDSHGRGLRIIDEEDFAVLEYGRLKLEEKRQQAKKRALESRLL